MEDEEVMPMMEIIGKSPRWILRWGNAVLLVFIIAVGLCISIFKYPEKIRVRAIMSASDNAKPITATQNGRLIKLFLENNTRVYKNQIIGYFENEADYNEVDCLSVKLDSAVIFLEQSEYTQVARMFKDEYSQLGVLQNGYNELAQDLNQFVHHMQGGIYERKRALLTAEIKNVQLSRQALLVKKQMRTQDYLLAQKTMDAHSALLDEKVISQQEYRELTSQLINKKVNFSEIDDAIFANSTQQKEKEREILEMEEQIITTKLSLLKSAKDLINAIKLWKRKVVIYAPVDGLLTYADFLQEHQVVQADQVIAYVSPGQYKCYMKLQIPQTDLGKIKPGQNVQFKFPAYRWQEYGIVTGQIEYISPVPTDSGYAARIAMPEKLNTSANKMIDYREGLVAQAEIIIDNSTILQRCYYSIAR